MSALIRFLRDLNRGETIEAADLLEANTTEIERLTALTEADKKEIGSYREGTGLRGEIRAVEAENEKLRAVYRASKIIPEIESLRKAGHSFPALEQALAAVEQSEAGDECPCKSGHPEYCSKHKPKGSPDAWIPRK